MDFFGYPKMRFVKGHLWVERTFVEACLPAFARCSEQCSPQRTRPLSTSCLTTVFAQVLCSSHKNCTFLFWSPQAVLERCGRSHGSKMCSNQTAWVVVVVTKECRYWRHSMHRRFHRVHWWEPGSSTCGLRPQWLRLHLSHHTFIAHGWNGGRVVGPRPVIYGDLMPTRSDPK